MNNILHWKHYHILILVTYLAMLLPAVWWLAGEYQYNRVYKNIATSQAQEKAEKEFDRECLTLTEPNKILTCYREKIKSARETQRSEEDLQSQKDMASWALGMLIVSGLLGFFSLGVAIYVAVIVRDTLNTSKEATEATIKASKATEEAANETRNIGRKQVRAYLSGRGGEFSLGKEEIICRFVIRNTGQSPAHNVKIISIRANWAPMDKLLDDPHTPKSRTGTVDLPQQNHVGLTIPAGHEEDIPVAIRTTGMGEDDLVYTLFKYGKLISFDCKIIWVDVFDDRESGIAHYMMEEFEDEPRNPNDTIIRVMTSKNWIEAKGKTT